jgi:hypothetical protein
MSGSNITGGLSFEKNLRFGDMSGSNITGGLSFEKKLRMDSCLSFLPQIPLQLTLRLQQLLQTSHEVKAVPCTVKCVASFEAIS